MFRQLFIAGICLLFAGIVLGQVYRWVDEDGIVHFTDRPVEGAERIVLPEHRPSSGVQPRTPTSNFTRRNDPQPEPEEEEFGYESLEFISPAAEETLWNIESVLNARIQLSPPLQRGHRIRVYFDGEMQNVSGTAFQIQEVFRGVHNIQAEVVDQNGQLMIRSQPNRFYVQQNAIGR